MRNALRDPQGGVTYWCDQHGFMVGDAVAAPRHACEQCWCMFFLKLEAVTPAAEREAMLENLVRVLHNVDQLSQHGDFDLHITRRPKIDIDMDADKPLLPEGAEPVDCN